MATQDKKQVLKELLESGKQKGRLTTKEISDALEELDYDVEQVTSCTIPLRRTISRSWRTMAARA